VANPRTEIPNRLKANNLTPENLAIPKDNQKEERLAKIKQLLP
jgi:hypothetical protein